MLVEKCWWRNAAACSHTACPPLSFADYDTALWSPHEGGLHKPETLLLVAYDAAWLVGRVGGSSRRREGAMEARCVSEHHGKVL